MFEMNKKTKGRFFASEKGSVMILVALMMTVLLGFGALAIDVGDLYFTRRQMVTAADAGALAGARELAVGNGSNAVNVARDIAEKNGAELTDEVEVIDDWEYNGEAVTVMRVVAGQTRQNVFARVLSSSLGETDVMAESVAIYGHPIGIGELFPIYYEGSDGMDLPEGEQELVTDKDTGNWGILAVTLNPGANEMRDAFEGDYEGMFMLDETYFTEPGQMGEPRVQGIEARMIKAVEENDEKIMRGYIPIVEEFIGNDPQGRTEVNIIGFAPFKITDVITDHTKDNETNFWYAEGSEKRLDGNDPPTHTNSKKTYPGEEIYEKNNELQDDFPKGTVIGYFLPEDWKNANEVSGITQDDDNFNNRIKTVRLIK